ncbi:cation:proton antiporter [Virgibacillus pantothenticus]|uniref:cation:proton antiporter n=1 Tax=Virgibacillus pantothenticus TaxID=1473 RepID=UPI00098730FD|nr:sodium:proton antiporter [Virgibacillus pantothenticus]
MTEYHLLLLLIIGYLVFSMDKKQNYFPVPVVLVLLGVVLSVIPFFQGVIITKDILFTFFLPALLFISAYQFSMQAWQKNQLIISSLSSIGLFLQVIILGLFIYVIGNGFLPISFVAALLIASLLTPTDPVSVVNILKQASSDKEDVADIVEGESMLNDGTSIVVFTVLLQMYGQQASFHWLDFMQEFILVSFGGVVVGIAFGWFMSKAVHFTHHRQYQVMLSIIVAYGSFYLGEALHVSGVLATVTAGMMLSYEFGKNIKEAHFRESLDGFWGIVEPTLLSIIFLLIGIQTTEYLEFSEWTLAFFVFVCTLLVRFMVITGMTQLHPAWRKMITVKDSGVIAWAGIKGTMSVALVLGLEATLGADHFIVSLTFVVIILSFVVQSIGVYPIMKKLNSKGMSSSS